VSKFHFSQEVPKTDISESAHNMHRVPGLYPIDQVLVIITTWMYIDVLPSSGLSVYLIPVNIH
jgi:hypothetical protein